jgi:hypothetical protein
MHTRGEAGEDVGGEEEWGKGQEGEDQLPGERRLARVWVCPMNRRAIKLASRLYNILLVQFRVRTADLRTLFPSKCVLLVMAPQICAVLTVRWGAKQNIW